MGLPQKEAATYQDLLAVPEHLVAEIIDGELVTSPRPAIRHASAGSGLMGWLDGPFRRGRGGPGGWVILFEPELHLHADVLVPDVAGWRRERMPKIPDAPAIDVPPDWVCEILSPRTAALDRANKMPIYARERVSHLWLVDPAPRTLETYRLGDGAWILLGTFKDDARVRAQPFEAIEFELADLWAD
jgi:Uma2 family endonuclease